MSIAAHGLEDRVHLLDFRPDVVDLLAAMDVYLHLSTEPEPFGLSIVEAMATGLPVVATAHGGPCESLEDGISGVLVPPNDAPATATAVAFLLTHPERRREIGDAARERALRLFQVDRYTRELQQLYGRVLEAHDSRPGKARTARQTRLPV